MSSNSISEIFYFAVFYMHLGYLHSKEAVTANNVPLHPNLAFFLECSMLTSTKRGRYRNKPGVNFAVCTYDESKKII